MKLPTEQGSYALVMRMQRPAEIVVGRLGPAPFAAGLYVYTGSAHGPGGIRGRAGHHQQRALRPRWHIDFLRNAAALVAVGWRIGREGGVECAWAARLRDYPAAKIPLVGFGASDCQRGCAAHLAWMPGNATAENVFDWLGIGAEEWSLARG